MALSAGFPPIPGDPGGGNSNFIDGTYTGATLPWYMDPKGNHGELIVLRMEPVKGKMPDHPFILRKSIEKRVNGKIEGAMPEAQGRTYALKVRSRHHLEKLLSMTHLTDGTAVKVTHHPGLNSTRCVISCRDLMKVEKDEDILEYLADQKVTDIRRIKRKVGEKTEFTSTVILTISGTTRPETVDIGYQRIRTRPYYPAPMLCFQCFNFGHTRQRCKETTATCGHCGQQHEVVRGVQCPNPAYCNRCKAGDHSLGSRSCPIYKIEDKIQHIRVDKGLSYPEARRLYAASTGHVSFAGITAHSKDKAIADLKAQVDALSGQMTEKNAEIQALKEQASAGSSSNNNEEFQVLRNLIDSLKSQLELRDKRIQALEEAAQKNSRMDIARKHGTIEDLISRVSALESSAAKKDEEIQALRKENEAYKKILGSKILPKPQRQQATKEKLTPSVSAHQESKPKGKGKKSVKSTPNPVEQSPMAILSATMEIDTPPENAYSTTTLGEPPYVNKETQKKTLEKQNSEELTSKRPKTDEPKMYISDSEEAVNTEVGAHSSAKDPPSGFVISSDEGSPDDETEILP